MRYSHKTYKGSQKEIARIKYKERQIEHFIKWSIQNKGGLRWKDLIELHNKYNIKCYG